MMTKIKKPFSSNVTKFFNNRVVHRDKQLQYWKMNWRSGCIRALERLLIGANISDRLGGDLSQFSSSSDFYSQVKTVETVNNGSILSTLAIEPIGGQAKFKISGVNKERKILSMKSAKVDLFTGLIRTDDGLVLDAMLPQWQKLLYMGGMLDAYASTNKKLRKVEGSWSILPVSDYFFHTLTEEIATLLAIRKKFPHIKVMTHQSTPRWALDLLSALKFEYVVMNQRGLLVEELIASTSVGCFSKYEFDLFSKAVEVPHSSIKHKIFISRGKLSRSDEHLERELIATLSLQGYEIIFPEDLAIQDQISAFRNASEVVSFHGGALSHLVWCEKGTKVLEVFNHPYRSYDFARIAHEGQLKYYSIDTVNQPFESDQLIEFLNT